MSFDSRLRALLDLSRALSSSLELREVLREFSTHATEMTGASATSISAWDRERDCLITLTDYKQGLFGELVEGAPEYALADYPQSRRVLETQEAYSVRVADPHGDPSEKALLQQEGHRSLLMLPLVNRGEAIGLIEIVDDNDRDWSGEDAEFCRSLADVAAAAIANAQLHERHRAAEERYRSLIEHLPAVTYIDVAGTGEPIYVSPQISTVMGVPREEWLDDPTGWAKRLHPEDAHAVGEYAEAVLSCAPYAAEYRLIDMQGRTRWFRDAAGPVRGADGKPVYMQGVIFDITARKEAEAALAQSEARFREMLENVRLVAVTCDVDGKIMFCNQYLAELTGWSREELVGRDWIEVLTPEDHREMEERTMSLTSSGHTVSHYESAIVTRDGRRRLLSWNNTVMRDIDGQPMGVASIGEDITDRRDAERELERLAYHDPLTGLPNRTLFQEHLDLALARARRSGDGVAVLYVDLDDFKLVNDSFGHSAGDQLLCEVATRLRGATRASDVVARQGGDEFLILIADLDVGDDQASVDIEDIARHVAKQVREALQAPMVLADTEIYTSASLGISIFPVDAADAESLLKHADIAMYKAKDSGRDGYQLFAAGGRDPRAQLSMAGRLRRAVEREELVLHYQPLVHLSSGGIVGAEALLRWRDGTRGLVPPNAFIPLAERTGLIGPISEWVIEEACRQSAEWRAADLDMYVSVNLPAIFWKPTAMRGVLDTIESFGLAADRMMIEITESTVMADAVRSEPIIAELHERGLRLAIDDFGTGHSSLSRLNQMQVTTLKIDRSFVSDLPGDASAAVLVSTIIQLARNLGLQPLAEGIETEEQRRFLVEHGCPLGQGFLFSKAVPADQIVGLYYQQRPAA
jgi:diguanylate cyclase (GGDEF)-like protein/PAS domain S-box-containing protein